MFDKKVEKKAEIKDLQKRDELLVDHNRDGVDRRGFLKCMAWAGTGAFCVMQGGVM
jgi:Icc protein